MTWTCGLSLKASAFPAGLRLSKWHDYPLMKSWLHPWPFPLPHTLYPVNHNASFTFFFFNSLNPSLKPYTFFVSTIAVLIQGPMTFGLDSRVSFLIDPLVFPPDLSPVPSLHPSQSDFLSVRKDHIIPCRKQYITQDPFCVFLLHFIVKPTKLGAVLGFALLCFISNVRCTSSILLYKYQLVD